MPGFRIIVEGWRFLPHSYAVVSIQRADAGPRALKRPTVSDGTDAYRRHAATRLEGLARAS